MQKKSDKVLIGLIGIVIGFALGVTYTKRKLQQQIQLQNERIEALQTQISIQNENKGISIAKDLQNRMKQLKETLKVADSIVDQLENQLQKD